MASTPDYSGIDLERDLFALRPRVPHKPVRPRSLRRRFMGWLRGVLDRE